MESPKENRNEQTDPKVTSLIGYIRARLALGILLLLIVGSIISVIGFWFPFPAEFWGRMVQELGIGFIITAAITGAAQIFLIANSEQLKDRLDTFVETQVLVALKGIFELSEGQRRDLENAIGALGRIEQDIQKQTLDLVQAVASLDAMRQSGIVRIYQSRTVASEDIARDLIDPKVTQIHLIGISLNDFVLGTDTRLSGAWKVIVQYIQGEKQLTDPKRGLNIRVMVIDPNCLGAQLRARGEEREFAAVAGRLKNDVIQTAWQLYELQKIAKAKVLETGVKFEFRLYRVPPVMFLCRTDVVSYVQQYHFWANRAADVPIPVLRYRGLPETRWHHSLHRETETHFDWIWDHASISADEFLYQKVVGIDRGMYSVGAVNVFNDPAEAKGRLLWLLKNVKKRLYIQGISLKAFFDAGEFFAAINELVDSGKIDIKILLLNPDSEQAHYRSFREYLFVNPVMTFAQFRSEAKLHSESELNADTKKTMARIKNVFGPKDNALFQVRTYDSAPACFLFIADDSALVEQYHYGKILPEGYQGRFPVILGKDSPLIEYNSQPSDLFESNPLRSPFKLMLDHFNFVFERCAQPPVEHLKASD